MTSILLIDDEERVGGALRFALSSHGYEVVQERDARAGLERVRSAAPDCVLLDVDLGGDDGLDCCRTLKSDPTTSAIPVILLSGLVDPASMARGLAAGADDYIGKPFTPAVLRARIESQLRRRSGE
jgi:DNA-binding response OmpR family regulator